MLDFYKPRRKELKLNFCRTCEIEFEIVFRDEFNRGSPIPAFGKHVACTRNYLDNDGIVKTCLRRLTESLVGYVQKVRCHREINKEKYANT